MFLQVRWAAVGMMACTASMGLYGQDGAPEEFKKFGFSIPYTEEARSYPRSNQDSLDVRVKHYGFIGHWDLAPSLERESLVEFGWRRERMEVGTRLLFENDLYGLMLGSRRPFSLNPWFALVAQGGMLAQFESTSPMSASAFNAEVGPALYAVNISNQPATATTNVTLTGGRLTLDLALSLRWAPSPQFESRTGFGGYVGAELLTIPTGSDAIPLFVLRWGLEARQRLSFVIGPVEPWVEYRFQFLAAEKNAIGPYTLGLPLRHTFFLGLTFRFSLLLFG